MNRSTWYVRTAVALLLLVCVPVDGLGQDKTSPEAVPPSQATPPSEAAPPIEDLGDERYRIGAITVDKAARSFSVSGKVLHLRQPLEYLAVKTNGAKGYESLLEIDTLAVEFQLACILIGLDEANSVKPRFQFDKREAVGQAVDIKVSWGEGDEARTVKASNALVAGDETFDDHDWVYVGSMTSTQDGRLFAEESGTLIGFVHDPFSIIEHRHGAGLGAYGMMKGNVALLPAEGSVITLTVSVITE